MSSVNEALYPSINTTIKYQQDWQKDFYHKKISEFKASPVGFDKIVFLGNSITQGLLRHTDKLIGNNIINRGISGDHTDGVSARLKEVIHYKPKAVFLLIGVNDLFEDNRSKPERTPEYIAKNILLICKEIKNGSKYTQIFIQTILPINNKQYLSKKPNIEFLFDNYSPSINEQIDQVNKIIKSDSSLNVIDLHSAFLNENLLLNPKFSTDGVHLNELGYQNWVNIINPILKEIK
tara:strand:- start:260 stop:964 length:705 start_codon:yes stop_codon:yes gene_type:complete